MRYLLAVPVVLFPLVLAVGALTGRVRVRGCCTTGTAARDLRMRAAFHPDPAPRSEQAGAGA